MNFTKRIIFFIIVLSMVCIMSSLSVCADEVKKNELAVSIEDKIYGLMTVWAEIKFNYPLFDKLPNLNWDEKVKEYIPRVINAGDIDEYYNVLREFAALLNDGHTWVIPPGFPFNPKLDYPPLEVQVIEGKFIITRMGETDEIKSQNIYAGLEVLEIDGIEVNKYFTDKVLRYDSRGTKQANEALPLLGIFLGQKGSRVSLKVRDFDAKERVITLARSSLDKNSEPFIWELFQNYMANNPLETDIRKDGIIYIKIKNFVSNQLPELFGKFFDSVNWDDIHGVIIDVRGNLGGSDSNGVPIVKYFIDKTIKTLTYKTRKYVPALRSWGLEPEWHEGNFYGGTIEPRDGKRYIGPLVFLIGKGTNSASEDFIALFKSAHRGMLIGEKTAGNTGNPIIVPLPAGGLLQVLSLITYFPDGKEFVHIGIEPDVEIHPSVQDIYNKLDPVLNKGFEILMNWEKWKIEKKAQ